MKKKKFEPVVIPECPWHLTAPRLSYLGSFEDAEKRHAKGQEQVQCPVCRYWFWPEYFGVDPISKIKVSSK